MESSIRVIHGLEIKGVRELLKQGYRLILAEENESCTIYERRDTGEEEILKINTFNDMCKLRIQFVKEDIVTLVDWAQIQPKQNGKGLNLFYEKERLTIPKEILTN